MVMMVLATACGTVAEAPPRTTDAAGTPTVPSTVSTTEPESGDSIPMEIQGCAAPPTTFSPLCETVELIEEWHVDRPVDLDALAALAVETAANHVATGREDPPRTFFCAIPDEAFLELCTTLHERVMAEGLPVGETVEAAVVSMVDLGLDPFTWYISPQLAGGFRSDGLVGGVGILLDATDAAGSKCVRIADVCPLRVVYVLEGNPGAEAGLMVEDVIESVDGESVTGKGFVEVAAAIGGDETGEVSLGLVRDGSPLEIVVARRELDLPATRVELPFDGVGYLRIPDFSVEVPFVVDAALEALLAASPHTIVIDLRDNPGGLVDAVVSVASMFIQSGDILSFEGPDGSSTYPAHEAAVATTQNLVVLVNGATASSAEILAGALRDRRGAVLVGTSTYGKNALQIPFELRNGGELHVAVARWTTPDGDSVGNGGLVPDRVVEFLPNMTIEELTRLAIQGS